MAENKGALDASSILVLLITLVLFVLALFTKGLTHDILLEAAVFLVSVKLIMLMSNINRNTKLMMESFKQICEMPDRRAPSADQG